MTATSHTNRGPSNGLGRAAIPLPDGRSLRRIALLVLTVGALGLLAYSGIRARTLSFTHDEANSYDLLQGNVYWLTVANHHPLNTFLMRTMEAWLGPSEWSLRLPNVVAHALYLTAGLLLLARGRHVAPMALGFALCNLNPFLLDFFSLARGYGLALGLSMSALWFLALAWESAKPWRRGLFVFAGAGCAALADLANYTWLNLHLPLLAAGFIVLLVDERLAWRRDRGTVLAALTLAASNAVFIRSIASRVRSLQQAGQLYARGELGFLPDTVGSSLRCYFYDLPHPEGLRRLAFLCVVIGFPALILTMGAHARRERRLSFAAILALTTAIAILVPTLEHELLKAPYPNERIALYYFPLLGVLTGLALDELLSKARPKQRLALGGAALALAAFMAFHLAQAANLGHALTWKYDAHTRDAMAEIERHFRGRTDAGQIRVGNSWGFQPAMDYYRKTHHYAWLAPIRRDDPVRPGYELLYLQEREGAMLEGYHRLKNYPDIETVILVRDAESPPGPERR